MVNITESHLKENLKVLLIPMDPLLKSLKVNSTTAEFQVHINIIIMFITIHVLFCLVSFYFIIIIIIIIITIILILIFFLYFFVFFFASVCALLLPVITVVSQILIETVKLADGCSLLGYFGQLVPKTATS